MEQGKSYEAYTHLMFSTSLQVEVFIADSICFVLFVVSLQNKVDKFANVAYKTNILIYIYPFVQKSTVQFF